jgi:hypothetical protein
MMDEVCPGASVRRAVGLAASLCLAATVGCSASKKVWTPVKTAAPTSGRIAIGLDGTSSHAACKYLRTRLMPDAEGIGHHTETSPEHKVMCLYTAHRQSQLGGLAQYFRAPDHEYATAVYISADGSWRLVPGDGWLSD